MIDVTLPIVLLLLIDALFILFWLAGLFPLSKYKHAAYAVMKRNFIGYFSNPAGYLFIVLFVTACSALAFWPHDFFNDNLATLQQLNEVYTIVMLLFIPTITMGIWADERRQGTDELLLTVPADDWDIVLGKYLAVSGIYTVALLFSQIANFLVLNFLALGDIDIGLFATTYLGYWVIGLAMLSLGMVGSFLTKNLTIGAILGAVLNLPLVVAQWADAIIASDVARTVAQLSYGQQFYDFSRGVISLRAVVFFAMVIALGLYLSVVLVGRRHWWGGRDGQSMLGHYVARALALAVTAFGLTFFFVNYDWRVDATMEQVSSLSPNTRQLIQELDTEDRSILVEAFISKDVPEDYVQTKLDLISKLNEFSAIGGNKINVRIYDDLELFSEAATRAEEQYGLEPATVFVNERGAFNREQIFLGAAFTSGLDRVIVPFFDRGIPVEYELIRSISTVASPQRRKLGIVNTDAQLFGGFDMQRMTQRPKELIVEELEKQYEVVQIDPSSPIQEEVDVLLAVQPSSLTPPQMENLVAAIRSGVPTAIFEDPMPVMMSAPGTSQPKMPRGGMMGMGGAPEPKGDIQKLWSMLGIQLLGKNQLGQYNADVVWQDYNPYKKARHVTPEWVFITPDLPHSQQPMNPDNAITAKLNELLFLFPGGIENVDAEGLTFTPLVTTSEENVGVIGTQELQTERSPMQLVFRRRPTNGPVVLAARITGTVKKDLAMSDAGAEDAGQEPATDRAAGENAAAPGENKIDVVFVSDIDLLDSEFLRVRAQPDQGPITWKFDNVTFVLNVIDSLAGDSRFIEIRKRQPHYSTLKLVEETTSSARDAAEAEIESFEQEFQAAEEEAKQKQQEAIAELQKKVDELNQKAQQGGQEVSSRDFQRALQAALQQLAIKQEVEQRRLDSLTERLTRDRDRKLKRIQRELDMEIKQVENRYKRLAVLVPPIPPLLIGLVVFAQRRSREKESVTAARRR